jgi:hypothetical protein
MDVRRTFSTFLVALGFLGLVQGQSQEISVGYYLSTGDFLSRTTHPDEVILEVRSIGNDYIYARDIRDSGIGKKSDDGNRAYAIAYEGNDYVNLKYSENAFVPDLFVRIDLTGRFCLAVMEPAFEPVLDKAAQNPTQKIGGMTHTYDAAIGGIFVDQEGKERQIFIIDTKDLSIVIPYKAKNAPINLLSKSTLKWLVGKENFKGSVKDYTVEEIVLIVEDLNQRQ